MQLKLKIITFCDALDSQIGSRFPEEEGGVGLTQYMFFFWGGGDIGFGRFSLILVS